MKICAYCGKSFNLKGGRYKYCSDECAVEAHRAQCRENFKRRYILKHEQELERYRKYHAAHLEQKRAATRRYYAKKKAAAENEMSNVRG